MQIDFIILKKLNIIKQLINKQKSKFLFIWKTRKEKDDFVSSTHFTLLYLFFRWAGSQNCYSWLLKKNIHYLFQFT